MSWQFHDGAFQDYDPQSSSLLEAAFQANQPSVDLHIFNQHYRVDLIKKTQTNIYTGFVRPVRRLVTKQATKTQYAWWYQGDTAWEPYSLMQSRHLEKMYASNPKATIALIVTPYTYMVDFNAMTQRNTRTNRVRAVDRRICTASTSGLVANIASDGSATTPACIGDYISAYLAKLPPYPLSAPLRIDFDSVPLTAFLDADNIPALTARSDDDGDCPVCLGSLNTSGDTTTPLPCGHRYHTSCITSWLKSKGSCPNCRRLIVVRPGGCPDGVMTVAVIEQALPGDDGVWDGMDGGSGGGSSGGDGSGSGTGGGGGSGGKTIVITWGLHGGVQDERHPNAGVPYPPDTRVHYMPANRRGVRLLELFIKGWACRQLFTIGKSLSRNIDNVVVYGSIHMRSNKSGPFGWPAPAYFSVTEDEFKQVGITYEDEE